jgi:hypothetical protein
VDAFGFPATGVANPGPFSESTMRTTHDDATLLIRTAWKVLRDKLSLPSVEAPQWSARERILLLPIVADMDLAVGIFDDICATNTDTSPASFGSHATATFVRDSTGRCTVCGRTSTHT